MSTRRCISTTVLFQEPVLGDSELCICTSTGGRNSKGENFTRSESTTTQLPVPKDVATSKIYM